jgi:hypothetical protein
LFVVSKKRQKGTIQLSVTCLQSIFQYSSLVEARDSEQILVEAFVTHDSDSKMKRRYRRIYTSSEVLMQAVSFYFWIFLVRTNHPVVDPH